MAVPGHLGLGLASNQSFATNQSCGLMILKAVPCETERSCWLLAAFAAHQGLVMQLCSLVLDVQ